MIKEKFISMFNYKYGLTKAVLDGSKTMTRRIVPQTTIDKYSLLEDNTIIDDARYDIGDVVAVAQSYKELGYDNRSLDRSPKDLRIVRGTLGQSKGWNNKMFVRAEACKHHIRITDISIERLQDISNADCLREGIRKSVIDYDGTHIVQYTYFCNKRTIWYDTHREAFAALIDLISGKGTWESNPYVFVYEFELAD